MGIPPLEFLLYYAGGLLLLIALLFFRRPSRGMRLRLRGKGRTNYKAQSLKGRISPDMAMPRVSADSSERSINVIFSFNGETWDAFEVFGIPAGSSMGVVEAAYRESLNRVEESSRAFLHAAFKAISESESARRKSG